MRKQLRNTIVFCLQKRKFKNASSKYAAQERKHKIFENFEIYFFSM